MTLSAGSRLGPYEILGQIGAGGMGEVYRAKDPRLNREVAIKVLPASFSQDADRLRRFEQEAKAAGVLNHPNITVVYDIGTNASDGAPYVVQELLEGETLRSELAGGRFSPRKAIDTATQIAEGLAAAHEKGIVHRDLKPENLFVTRDGRVKILDFGLAKLTHQEEGSQATNLPTETKGTEPGVVLGTLGYMSPEQVRGKNADARSDIFSFGAILYEMLSGKRAFHGDSAADTVSAILREDPPDLSVTNQSISPGLERIVRHCLEKNPERRFQSARDLAFNLGELSGASGTAIGAGAAHRTARTLPWMAVGGLAALLAAFAAGHFLRKPAAPSSPTFQRLTFRRGNIGGARFAPDGKTIVYGASWEGKPLEIFTLRPGLPETSPIGFPGADLFSISSKGELALSLRDRYLGGGAGTGTLARAPLGGGAPREILEFVEYADWTPDGSDIAIIRFREGRNRVEFPVGKVLYATTNGLNSLRFSPRGDRLAFVERGRGTMTVDLAGKTARLDDKARPQRLGWSPKGDEVWMDDRTDKGEGLIRAVGLGGANRVLLRAPDRILFHDSASDGRVLIERATGRKSVLWRGPKDAQEKDLAWFDASDLLGLSDDGRTVLLQESGFASGANGSVFLRKVDGAPAVKLGEGHAEDLSPDGKWVILPSADRKSFTLVPTGAGTPISISLGGLEASGAVAFFPSGRRIVTGLREAAGKPRHLAVVDVPSGRPRTVSLEGFNFSGQPVSPDEKWIVAFRDWEEDLFLFPTEGGEPHSIPDTKRLDPVRWSLDGKSFYASETGSIPMRVVRVDVATGRRELWKELAPPDLSGMVELYDLRMTPDASAYAYVANRAVTSDLFLVEGLK